MITIKATGINEVIANIDSLNEILDNGSILDMALEVSLVNTQRRFLDKEDPDGNPWMKSFAGAAREFKGFPFGTLYDTGNLFRSIGIAKIDNLNGVLYQDDAKAPYGFDLFDTWYFLGPSDEDMGEITGNALGMLLKGWRF